MEWSAEGIVIGTRRHGENHAILELMTRDRGRHLGMVRGGSSSRLRPALQAGNTVMATWRARLDEHMGVYAVEATVSRTAHLLTHPMALHAVSLAASHVRTLAERDPHPALYDTLAILLEHLDEPGVMAPLLVRFEMALLDELGFGLDLASCAGTGATDDLTHVSPRSGRAVSHAAAEPYRDRLFRLPGFLRGNSGATPEDVADGFRLTGHFLERHVWGPRNMPEPDCRRILITLAQSAAPLAPHNGD
jgi:DNA repair protein RecO (recombination protein O)